MTKAIDDVIAERFRQTEKWGYPQKAMLSATHGLAVLAEEFGEAALEVVEMVANDPGSSERLTRLVLLRHELIQTAAVAIQMAEHIDDGHLK